MADYPALPLWTDAYLADTTHLSDAEHGRYMLLLIHMWRTPGCRLPNDDDWLARKLNRSIEDIKRDIRPLLTEFFRTTGNWLYQKRLKHERAYLDERSEKQSARAKSRWDKGKGTCRSDATEHDPAHAPTPTPSKKETPEPTRSAGVSFADSESQKESPARLSDGDGSAAVKRRSPPPTAPPTAPLPAPPAPPAPPSPPSDEPDDIPFEAPNP